MKTSFEEMINCPVLRDNFELFYGMLDPNMPEAGLINTINAVTVPNGQLTKPLPIFDQSMEKIYQQFSIQKEDQEYLKIQFNQSAKFYLLLYSHRFSSVAFKPWLSEIDQIGKTAAKLESLIDKVDSNFFETLTLFNHFEKKEENEPSVSEYFNSLLEHLRILKRLRTSINNSELGKAYGFGVPSRRKNNALNFWIGCMYDIWTNRLKRNMKRDKFNLSGRKNFLNFLEASIAPLHLEIISDPYSPQDRLDSALKAHQKLLKIHGENTP